ncbi:hypothetical protein, partial [Shewanella mangrovisoli]|uniref:hypothetical protein n=1 Tax=Shewanella mangrovisoli TaxID=2864211 RepID=UPI00313DF2CF
SRSRNRAGSGSSIKRENRTTTLKNSVPNLLKEHVQPWGFHIKSIFAPVLSINEIKKHRKP